MSSNNRVVKYLLRFVTVIGLRLLISTFFIYMKCEYIEILYSKCCYKLFLF